MMTTRSSSIGFITKQECWCSSTTRNIAQVYDMGEVDQSLYNGDRVRGRRRSRAVEDRTRAMQAAVPVPVALHVGMQICEALGYRAPQRLAPMERRWASCIATCLRRT